MFRRTTATAFSAVLTLATAAAALAPTVAQADPSPSYTGHVQVIVDHTIIGCIAQDGTPYPGITTNPAKFTTYTIAAGSQQNLTIVEGGPSGVLLGVDGSLGSPPMIQHTMGYTFLGGVDPVPAGSPSVNRQQSAIRSIDPATMVLKGSYVWPDSTTEDLESWWYPGDLLLGLSTDVAAMRAAVDPAVASATFRLGEACSGAIPYTPQAITFTSAAPSPAYQGQTYALEATGGGSGNPVTFSSQTPSICSVNGATVSFTKPGTCTIDANQAAAALDYTAAPTVTQQITVSAFPSTVNVNLDSESVVTGQNTTATAHVSVTAGAIIAAGGTVQFAVDGTPAGSPVTVDSQGKAVSPVLSASTGTRQVTGTYVPGDTTNYLGSLGNATLTVAAADTTTKVSVTASSLTATVKPVAPGAGTPSGKVTFYVDGISFGSANLQSGTATLSRAVPADKSHSVAAQYAGDNNFNASSDSTSRSNPTISARVTSAHAPHQGWYNKPVKVTFTCSTTGANLVTACPAPVTVSRQPGGSVTRTIRTADGGIAKATATVKIDTSAPSVSIKGVKAGRRYTNAPKPKCSARDNLSGVRRCQITTKRHGTKVVVTAKATDVAGNVRTKRVTYRLTRRTI